MLYASVGIGQTRNDPQYEGVDEFCMFDFYSGARTEVSHCKFFSALVVFAHSMGFSNFWNLLIR
jgi:hypothetical protein